MQIKKKLADHFFISDYLLQLILDLLVAAGLLTSSFNKFRQLRPKPSLKENPLVSIVIVNKNGAIHLETLFSSLTKQDYQQLEVVLVDNQSTDNSIAVVKNYWPATKIVIPKKDVGFAEGNNLGIKAAAGSYLFLLNNDTKLEPDTVSQLVAVALNKPDAAAIVPKMYFYYLPAFINSIGNSVYPSGWGSDNYIGHLDIGQFSQEMEVFSACFGAVLIKREALAQVGFLDGRYKFYYEDADWSYRARLAGLKIYLAPNAVVYHKFNASMQSLTPYFKWQLVIGNRLRFVLKNLSVGTVVNFLRHYLVEDLRGVARSLKYRDWVMVWTYFKAYGRTLLNFPNIFWERLKVQRVRKVKDGLLFKAWPDLPALMDERGYPILDTGTIRRIYMHAWGTQKEQNAALVMGNLRNTKAK